MISKKVNLSSHEEDMDITSRWLPYLYAMSVFIVFVFTLFCRVKPGKAVSLFDRIILHIIIPIFFGFMLFAILMAVFSSIVATTPWIYDNGKETKRIFMVTYERPYVTKEKRREIKKVIEQNELRAMYKETDMKKIKEKQADRAEIANYLSKAFLILLMPITYFAVFIFPADAKLIPFPNFVRIGAKVAGGLGCVLLAYALVAIVCLVIDKFNTFDLGSRTKKGAYAKCLFWICNVVAMIAIPILVSVSSTDPSVQYPWAHAFENLKQSWFQILGFIIIFGSALRKSFRQEEEIR